MTEGLLWDACATYKLMTGENAPLMRVFVKWFQLQHSDDVFNLTPEEKQKIDELKKMGMPTRQEFLKGALLASVSCH